MQQQMMQYFTLMTQKNYSDCLFHTMVSKL